MEQYGNGPCEKCGKTRFITLVGYDWICGICRTGTIEEFRGEYRFLSNFWYVNVQMYGQTYRSVEHAYQAAKSLDPAIREVIRLARTPGDAKRLGQSPEQGGIVVARDDWEEFKFDAMYMLLQRKFAMPAMRTLLLNTRTLKLVEGNRWHDTVWGYCFSGRSRKCGPNGHEPYGDNNLGRLLMRVRDEVR